MIVKLDTQRLQALDQVREFLAGSRPLDLQPQTRAEALLHQHRTTGAIADRRRPRHPFPRRYTKADIGLLAEVDALHGTLSGPATRKLCVRALQLFGDRRFERLAAISNGHLYNLRHSTTYQRRRGTMPAPTRPVHIAIGERRRPFGQPGYLRVDSVHQGDLDGIKGLYHLNLVDEVTQFQFVGSVERIDTLCLVSRPCPRSTSSAATSGWPGAVAPSPPRESQVRQTEPGAMDRTRSGAFPWDRARLSVRNPPPPA